MKTEQLQWTKTNGWEPSDNEKDKSMEADLLFVFGSTELLKSGTLITELKEKFPKACFMGCSTSGEIFNTQVMDDSLAITAVQFSKTKVIDHYVSVTDEMNSYETGKKLIEKFDTEGLQHLFVLSDGLNVNGSELVRAMRDVLPDGVSVTGGLAGDGTKFHETFVILGDASIKSRVVSAIGFYGDALKIGYGSFGGWDTFGIERLVTKSKNNVLYELDGEPALQLYKSFLGEQQAGQLPSSGLLFPLSLRTAIDSQPVVRTILGIDENHQSLTFAGDIPEGAYVRLMKANIDRLIDGAVVAATNSLDPHDDKASQLAILISCVGRKLVLKQLIEEEVEGVRNILGLNPHLTGFYSYGEISPFSKDAKCELHNQTMTVTTFRED